MTTAAVAGSAAGIIFDFNGVIIDDERLHWQSAAETLRPHAVELSEPDYFERYFGLDDEGLFSALWRQQRGADLPDALRAELIAAKGVRYFELLDAGIRLFPGASDLIRTLAIARPLAICSGALRAEIDLVLQQTGLREYFAVIVAADDVQRGKPDPEGYLRAAEQLRKAAGLAPQAPIIAIEDSPDGIRAAKAAGLVCIAVAHSVPTGRLSAADHCVFSLTQLRDASVDGPNLFG